MTNSDKDFFKDAGERESTKIMKDMRANWETEFGTRQQSLAKFQKYCQWMGLFSTQGVSLSDQLDNHSSGQIDAGIKLGKTVKGNVESGADWQPTKKEEPCMPGNNDRFLYPCCYNPAHRAPPPVANRLPGMLPAAAAGVDGGAPAPPAAADGGVIALWQAHVELMKSLNDENDRDLRIDKGFEKEKFDFNMKFSGNNSKLEVYEFFKQIELHRTHYRIPRMEFVRTALGRDRIFTGRRGG